MPNSSGSGSATDIILASASPRRKEILSSLFLDFRIVIPPFEEISESVHPPSIPFENATCKAESVALSNPASLVIAADTVIEFDGRILGKPASLLDAEKMLMELSGRKHCVLTAVCIRIIEKDVRCVFGDTSDVLFREFDVKTVRSYLSKVHTLDKAGAYAIQESGDMLIKKIEGSYDNIVGFPTEKFKLALQSLGFCKVIRNLVPFLKLSS